MNIVILRNICYSVAILLSAFLLFQVQPLISKVILPWFGGSPSVWTTAMLFFQCTLCGGYFYAFVVSRRCSPGWQTVIHLGLLILAAWGAAYIIPGVSLKPGGEEQPALKILALLALTVGLPYFVLATTGPLVQHWYARANPEGVPFRLYALSNAGSLFALLSFPYLFEPYLPVQDIGRFWSVGFWVFAALCAAAVLLNYRLGGGGGFAAAQQAPDSGPGPTVYAPTPRRRLQWIALPALASLAFIATTDHVSHDIAPEPRLWITSLGLYLLTFIVCFDHPRWYTRRIVLPLTAAGIVLLSGRYEIPALFGLDPNYSLLEMRWSHFAVMFLICFVCHGELYRARPTNQRYLTEYYLLMSIGGAAGGLFVALVATHLFRDYYEWSFMLAGALALVGLILLRAPATPRRWQQAAAIAMPCLVLLVFYWEDPLSLRGQVTDQHASTIVYKTRNFYGTVSVVDRIHFGDSERDQRTFYSGQIVHGMQYIDPTRRRANITYYGEEGGAGETLLYAAAAKPSLQVAVVGLGAGTLANYARAEDEYDFFEINPEVVKVAHEWFDNLKNSKAKENRILLGDARLKFETLPADRRYDVIVLDAFSGDSVPLHLLTKQAFTLYQRHLKPDGFIVVHITNTYLNLFPVVRRQTQELGLDFRLRKQQSDRQRGIYQNQYVIMTSNLGYLAQFRPALDLPDDVADRAGKGEAPLWTDSFSSIGPIQRRN